MMIDKSELSIQRSTPGGLQQAAQGEQSSARREANPVVPAAMSPGVAMSQGGPSLETPLPSHWHDAGDVLSDLGTIMVLLMRLGIELRESKRMTVKMQHDMAIHEMMKGAQELKKAAVATMTGAALSLGVSVVMAGASMKMQVNSAKSNYEVKVAEKKFGATDAAKFDSTTGVGGILKEKMDKAAKAEGKAQALQHSMMGVSTAVNSFSQGVATIYQAEKAVHDAVAEEHRKVSDLASQDYQHFQDFFKDTYSLLQGIISEMNQAVKSATHV